MDQIALANALVLVVAKSLSGTNIGYLESLTYWKKFTGPNKKLDIFIAYCKEFREKKVAKSTNDSFYLGQAIGQ